MEWLKTVDRLTTGPAIAVSKIVRAFENRLNVTNSSGNQTLLVRPGGMGDLILLQVAVESLGLDPRDFDWLIETRSEPWAIFSELHYFCYDKPSHLTRLFRNRYATVVNSEQRFGLAAAFAVLLGKNENSVWGYSTNIGTSRSVPAGQRVSYDHRRSHEVIEFRRLVAESLGLHIEGKLSPSRARQISPRHQVVALGGAHSESRRFDSHQWVTWIREWRERGPVQIVAAPADEPIAREILAEIEDSELVVGGFADSMNALAGGRRVLTIDGGLVHVCSYFGVPTDVIFTSGIVEKWSPLADESRVRVRDDLSCQPCTRFGQVPVCRNAFQCKDLDQIQWVPIREH